MLFNWLQARWHQRERKLDLKILWPSCKRIAEERGTGLDHARAAFTLHAVHSQAWLSLGEEEVRRRIAALE